MKLGRSYSEQIRSSTKNADTLIEESVNHIYRNFSPSLTDLSLNEINYIIKDLISKLPQSSEFKEKFNNYLKVNDLYF